MPGIKLSQRLGAIASMVSPCDTFTDIGCDHALLPLWLISHGICKRAVASDINNGPLEKARTNAAAYGVGQEKIQFVLSDGLKDIDPPQSGKNTLSICGMGGLLISSVIEDSQDKVRHYDTLILSPHTKQYELRRYLDGNGYDITDEKYICEDKKLYVIIKAVPSSEACTKYEYSENDFRFGRFINEALMDTEVKERLLEESKALESLIKDNVLLPEDRKQALIKEAFCFREVLGI